MTSFKATLIVVLFGLGLVSCDRHAGLNLIGVQASEESPGIVIMYEDCDAGVIDSVRLDEVRGDLAGGEDDILLWEIRSQRASREKQPILRTFEVGVTPDAFTEFQSLRAATFPPDQYLVAWVETSELQTYTTFRVKDLGLDEVWSEGDRLSEDEFRQRAEAAC